jgi:hypothetical protein
VHRGQLLAFLVDLLGLRVGVGRDRLVRLGLVRRSGGSGIPFAAPMLGSAAPGSGIDGAAGSADGQLIGGRFRGGGSNGPGAGTAGRVTGGSGAESTFTASDTGRPSRRDSAAVIGSRSARSIASLAKSLGAASSAVPSSSPMGLVTRIQARCCGEVVSHNSCTTSSHTTPRLLWSVTCGLPSPRP